VLPAESDAMSKIRTFLIEDNQIILDSLTAALARRKRMSKASAARATHGKRPRGWT
jgi:hypothetical protein